MQLVPLVFDLSLNLCRISQFQGETSQEWRSATGIRRQCPCFENCLKEMEWKNLIFINFFHIYTFNFNKLLFLYKREVPMMVVFFIWSIKQW